LVARKSKARKGTTTKKKIKRNQTKPNDPPANSNKLLASCGFH